MNITEPPTTPIATLPPRPDHHNRNRVLAGAGAVVALVIGIAVGASASGTTTVTKPVPGPTITATQTVAGPTPTVTQTTHVKVTQTVNVPPPALTVASYHGTGSWNSPQFNVSDGAVLTVRFSYWNNTSGYGGDNFIADIVSSGDNLSLANDIAVSGGKTTTVYPDTSLGGSNLYHLEVQATGPWSVTISSN
jgi:hypothetical protein